MPLSVICFTPHSPPPRLRNHSWSWCLSLRDSHEAYMRLVLRVLSDFHSYVYNQECTLSTEIIQVVHQVLKCSKVTKNELLTKAPSTSFVFLVLWCWGLNPGLWHSRQIHVSEPHHRPREHLCLASLLCLLSDSSPTLLLWPSNFHPPFVVDVLEFTPMMLFLYLLFTH